MTTAGARAWALTGGRVLTPDGVHDGLAVVVAGSSITDVVVESDLPRDMAREPVPRSALVVPGLIDLHAHGALGRAFDETSEAGHLEVLRHHARHGVTAMQASLVSASTEELDERIEALGKTRASWTPDMGARILGVHLEGPFLAAAQRGAHNPDALREPRPSDAAWLLRHRGLVTMVTLAPELTGGLDLVTDVVASGAIPAVGHSEAGEDELAQAVDRGLTHVTHLWSGQTSLSRNGLWRVPGLVELCLASDHLTGEVVADGRHLPPALLEIARRCLGRRLVIVSDATPGAGLPEGAGYRLGVVDCRVRDGVGIVADGSSFGGSTTTLGEMVAYLHRDLGWPILDVIRAATETPARVLGLGRRGAVIAGNDADLAVFDADLAVTATLIAGVWAHRADGSTES